ncbi:malectin domain-containing carbohydrate-binding protein [Mangrovibacterium diazotrophicum]|uniref:Glycosyl hydrolase family 2 n=1 Tax=Mangrovibacterium diazotrophicum TaxID=1261403 RepID=A0A419W4B6_9BACT|nr:malectin domain-containing carbohydrate-binding protein [Mangrovibacterium diazotrophicum]RKD90280.1 glycosyl hydrolase family 2 [Mangrovibacterium diazotrophicum]
MTSISKTIKSKAIVLCAILLGAVSVTQAQPLDKQSSVRKQILLDNDWQTHLLSDENSADFSTPDYKTNGWKEVDIPHNWDDYGGYRRMVHGNLHGSAFYRKEFSIDKIEKNSQYFLWFEGVGSYATVWLNGDSIGYQAGGRTSFTLNVTSAIKDGDNLLAVRADHPAEIRDLPWVCGGCSSEWGFSEGSQPLGVFRPVHLIVTNNVRVEPFGLHIWNDKNISAEKASLNLTTEVRNYGSKVKKLKVVNRLLSAEGVVVAEIQTEVAVQPKATDTVAQQMPDIQNPTLWSLENPYLYSVETSVYEGKKLLDQLHTPYGIRWINWDIHHDGASNRFYLNGKPVLINGTAEYEHLMGRSHAFTDLQIKARAEQIMVAGYNAFRDAHQPHNLRYQEYWDENGLLWWPQMAAHIWFDNPVFRANFKQLLTDWMRERRNSPSIILWGLENESTLPEDFAKECSDLIRKLDPTASSQRLITTCNGGSGTDWNVIQNWSGTYGGKPFEYDQELTKQLLNGEYGAWRSIDLHTEGEFEQDGAWSEDRFCLLMESKIRLAEKAGDRVCGQFHWLLNSHENPGRTQGGEGLRELDRVGPVNYKGIISAWGEPLDAYYLYRANYVSAEKQPMVYIVSHTWPDRWLMPGKKDGIRVFSNCEEIELFNGVKETSLGRQKNPGRGEHFVWNDVDIENNVLYAVGYENGQEVAHDVIVLHHLPKPNGIEKLAGDVQPLNQDKNENYLYRVNCGGADYTDQNGNLWMADVRWDGGESWGSRSWTDDYPGLPAFYGSQRQTCDPIEGTLDWPLIQTFRYGQDKLRYHFPLPDGDYQLELYFVEPWYGTGGSLVCEDWRVFDVAVNGETVLKDLDIWKEAGHDRLLKKTVPVTVRGGKLDLSFPDVKSGQAVISAIAISTVDKNVKAAPASGKLLQLGENATGWTAKSWLNTGDQVDAAGSAQFSELASVLFGAEWLQPKAISDSRSLRFKTAMEADIYIALKDSTQIPRGFTKANKLEIQLDKYTKEIRVRDSETGEFWDEERTFHGLDYPLYLKRVKAGELVELPAFESQNTLALVAAVPVSTLDAARDLRPSVTYQAAEAENVGNGQAEEKWNKPARIVEGDSDAIVWTFQVGLASKYGLEIRYSNPSDRTIHAELSIESLDGRPMSSADLEFDPSGDRWRSLRTDTGSIINAGIYKLSIKLKEEGPMWFNFLKVQ